MAFLSSIYKKNKGTSNSTTPLNVNDIVQVFYNIIPKVNVFSVNSRIFAKESMNMPMMARDTNITRQNIAKLVKIQGASPIKKADSFFERASEREKLYESNFSKESSTLKSKPVMPTGVSGFAQKAVNFGAMSLGLVGFFGALTLAGNLISKMPGAYEGLKNMFVALAEGLSALSIGSLLKFGALLSAGALFGQTSLKFQGKAVIGMGAIGLGIGAFFTGLASGGLIGTFIDNSVGIKDMMVNLAEGLSAFDTQSLVGFGALLVAGGLFGQTSFATQGSAAIGMGAIGLGIGTFFSGLSLGAKGLDLFGGDPVKLKDLLVNFAEGLNAISELDGIKLLGLTVTLPIFGGALLAFLVTEGMAGIAEKLTKGLDKAINFLFGGGEYKNPIQKIAEDMKKISEISDLTKANNGVKNLTETLKIISNLSGDTIQSAINKTGLILAILERLNSGKLPANLQRATSQTAPPVAPTPIGPSGKSVADERRLDKVSETLVNYIKGVEGFTPKATWDYQQYSNGYGTEAKSSDEVITEQEADRRLREKLQKTQDYVSSYLIKNGYEFNHGQLDALTSFTYNLGPGGLKQLTNNGKRSFEEIKEKIVLYNMAGGKVLGGLQRRRSQELEMFVGDTSAPITNRSQNQTAGVTPTPAPVAPSVGASIASSSSAINQTRLSMNATPPTVVVNNANSSKDKNKPVDGKIASTMDFDFTDSMLGAPLGS
jgi:GH24 family phage-related lysozyme (muramidase)